MSLPRLQIDSYSAQLRDGGEQFGDRANKGAFTAILAQWRKEVSKTGEDPFGKLPAERLTKPYLSKVLASADLEAAGLVHGVVEEFAQDLAAVITRFLRLKDWRKTERIAIGGGFRGSRIGELAIGRAAIQLKRDGIKVELRPIPDHVDEAALIGALQLVPHWMLAGHDAILAADIGGTNVRVGVVAFSPPTKSIKFSTGQVVLAQKWQHAQDEAPSRTRSVARLTRALRAMTNRAEKRGLKLAPFIGIGCPGIINDDGSIKIGGQNLPGNWESEHFNIAEAIAAALPEINHEKPLVLVHNDAVLQGLSQIATMQDVACWGILTIGTGLGNARFTNVGDKAK